MKVAKNASYFLLSKSYFSTKGQSKYNESNVLLLSSFQCFTVFVSYYNDNSSLLAEWFQYFTGMIIQVKCWNYSVYYLSKSNPNSTIPGFHCNDDNNKTLFSFNLLWPYKVQERPETKATYSESSTNIRNLSKKQGLIHT